MKDNKEILEKAPTGMYAISSVSNEETKNCANMKEYASKLAKVTENISGKEIEKGIQSLFSFGATILSNQLPKDLDDFELLSFLIVK